MMWRKATLCPGNEGVASEILATDNYDHIKSLGRKVVNFDPVVWEDNSFKVVKHGCELKATGCPMMISALLSSKDEHILQTGEGVWSHLGEHRLGRVLEVVRGELWQRLL